MHLFFFEKMMRSLDLLFKFSCRTAMAKSEHHVLCALGKVDWIYRNNTSDASVMNFKF